MARRASPQRLLSGSDRALYSDDETRISESLGPELRRSLGDRELGRFFPTTDRSRTGGRSSESAHEGVRGPTGERGIARLRVTETRPGRGLNDYGAGPLCNDRAALDMILLRKARGNAFPDRGIARGPMLARGRLLDTHHLENWKIEFLTFCQGSTWRISPGDRLICLT